VTPSSKGIRNVEQNKHQLLHRIASIEITLIYYSFSTGEQSQVALKKFASAKTLQKKNLRES